METQLKPYMIYYLWKKDAQHSKNDVNRNPDYVRQYMAINSSEAIQMLKDDLNSPLIKIMGVAIGKEELPCGIDLMKI